MWNVVRQVDNVFYQLGGLVHDGSFPSAELPTTPEVVS